MTSNDLLGKNPISHVYAVPYMRLQAKTAFVSFRVNLLSSWGLSRNNLWAFDLNESHFHLCSKDIKKKLTSEFMEKLNNRPRSGTFPKPTVHPRRSSLQFSSNHNSVKVSII